MGRGNTIIKKPFICKIKSRVFLGENLLYIREGGFCKKKKSHASDFRSVACVKKSLCDANLLECVYKMTVYSSWCKERK